MKKILQWLVIGLSAFSLRAAEGTKKPNIIFILADDLGYGDIGPFGQKIIRTPTLDKLARTGMKFTQHYAGSPVCAPSRCVLITGRHPGHAFIRDNHEIGTWYSFEGQMPLPVSEPSLAGTLKSAGYATAAFGKWGLGGVGSPGDPLRHGFDHFFGFNDQRQAHNYYPQYLNDDEGKLVLTGNTNVSEKEGLSLAPGADPNDSASYASFIGRQYAPDLCCERALQFIRDHKEEPFFLYYPTTVPHLALQVPEDSLAEYRGKLEDKPFSGGKSYLPQQYPRAAYAAMVTRLDRDIGRLVQLVKDLELEENTIFIFTSDNGGVFPLAGVDPLYFHSNGDLRGYKQDVYEGGIRVPLIVSWKGRIPAGTSSSFVCGFEDWLPTLLELTGASSLVPKGIDGISFAPTLLGHEQAARPFVYREFPNGGGQQAVRVGDWKLVRRHLIGTPKKPAAPTTELYNLAADPSEKDNVADAHPEVVARLTQLMAEQHTPSKEFPFPSAAGEKPLGMASRSSAGTDWPGIHSETRPWAYWWWMGSAVDQANLTRELKRYQAAGLGGVHIIPIYGAKGNEDKFIPYLTPKWMEMLAYTVKEAHALGMGVDMTTGSGWCFGGPQVTDQEANAAVVVRTVAVSAGGELGQKFDPKATQALVAFSAGGQCVELTDKIGADGSVSWSPGNAAWQGYAISQRPSGQKVKRAAPGGQGHMLNLIYPAAMQHYLQWFEDAFANYVGPKPRAMYHDSYEYRSDWAPDFFASFQKRRGYRLQTELPALFADSKRIPHEATLSLDHVARVKADYRETISDVMAEASLPLWTTWSHRHGFLTRNEAHGSPGNWLDLYAAADIPETEMFYKDRNKLVSKFASAAAHVTGRNLVAAETGTWLKEHFTETLADMKCLVDDLFLSGVNHVFYHGLCYSPDEAGWPGWHFYASYEMNPRNSIWHDVPALNTYVTRCQSVLQSGASDNDILLYWPIHDLWHNPAGMARQLTVHARDWFEDQPIGKTAEQLWNRGYAFDYVSDRQLANAEIVDGQVRLGGSYPTVVIPRTQHIPLETMRKLVELARAGGTVAFQESLPGDVPGWGQLEARRRELKELLNHIDLSNNSARTLSTSPGQLQTATVGQGRILVGDLETALVAAGVRRESMFDRPGVMCVRRRVADELYYFIANRSENLVVNDWIPLALGRARLPLNPNRAGSVVVMDPLRGQTGVGAMRQGGQGRTEVYLSLQPGESLILRCHAVGTADRPQWQYWEASGPAAELVGRWQVTFQEGGPVLPPAFQTPHLASWTESGGTNAQAFAGTARYTLTFDAPAQHADHWRLDLGRVCQSARVRLNDQELGTLITPPFRVVAGPLKPTGNVLEIEVTNVSANRIRDLDRRGVKWKNSYDINFVNLDYRPFDASNWPLIDSGLLGPATLTPVRPGP